MRMNIRQLKLFVLTLSAGLALAGTLVRLRPVAAQSSDPAEFFEKQVRPVLIANCAKCHNAKAQVAKLDLTSAEGFAKGGESGPLINQEQFAESRLLKVIGYNEALKMPPSGRLKDAEINAIATWVKMGAPWPAAGAVAAAPGETKAAPKSTREFTEEEKAYWAFQPLAKTTLPTVKDTAWVKAPLDAFVLAKLEAKSVKPAPPADKLTLLRRATYDLTGLPPTEKEMSDFLADNAPDAFAKVVERLLASPRYGEKWGRHWLDVARYADSTGNDEDHRYPHAWKYRDYVIKAFNDDMPYDQFTREQIAGDLLPAPDGGEVNRRGIIATGFLALGAKAIAQQDKMKMLYDVWDEQVDVTSKAFLGMTLACARCHNHKFDPILTKDYYAMIGMFASTRSFTNPDSHVSVVLEKPLVPKAEWQQYQAAKKAHGEKEKRLRLALDEINDAVKDALVKANGARLADYMLAARQVYQDGEKVEAVVLRTKLNLALLQKWVSFLKPDPAKVRGYLNEWNAASLDKQAEVAEGYQTRFLKQLEEWNATLAAWRPKYQAALADNKTLPDKPKFEDGDDRFFNDVYIDAGPFGVSDKDKKVFNAEQWTALEKLHKEQAELKKLAPPEPELACAVEEDTPVTQPVLIRGDYNNKGEEAPRAFPAILARYDTKPQFAGSGRLQFADWLTSADNPVPKRVLVNRLWQWHFGEGIVRTPDNLGKMGERPTHPELLDYLAEQFVKHGYSIKAMHRLLMLSSTYQMASENPAALETDPDNRLLSRFNRRRLSVEEMRDGLLAIDGTLDLTMGGSLQSGRGTDGETSQGRLSINPDKQKRRTVYLPLRRANLPTLLNLFDFGDATTMNGKRQLTNVATQALFWLNSEFLTERSTDLAKALLADAAEDDAARLAAVYRRILNRPASQDELAAGLKYITGYQQKFAGARAAQKAWQSYCRVLMASNDFLYLD
ncbi:MAG: PSD1 domain-containing protein [Acidobacteria bacterium]|nr:PSD1 domain-containing protein [Acidobacteriota bacterium]MBI3423411.1 PSD1 domain-containing protein [Acidobacteriota bacterium]